MSRLINVFVCDKDGYGLSGHKVKLYGGDPVKTDRSGKAALMAEGTTCTVYVDGREVYDGSVGKAPDPVVCRKS
jgi:hypothetical protein